MNPFACILANGFEDLLEVLPWLVILGIGFLIKIVTSAAKKKPAAALCGCPRPAETTSSTITI